MLRLKGQKESGEWVEFDVGKSLDLVDQTGMVQVYKSDDTGAWTFIDPTTIEAVEDDDAQVSKILDYIDKDIEDHPEHLIKPDPEMLAEIDELVEGIEIEEQPEDVILAALKAAHAFIDAMLSFYGTNLEVANWHMNGDTQSWDSFFDDSMRGDELELLSAAIKKAEGTELISGRVEAVEDGGQGKALLEWHDGSRTIFVDTGTIDQSGYPHDIVQLLKQAVDEFEDVHEDDEEILLYSVWYHASKHALSKYETACDPCKALLGEISILKGHIKLLRGIWQEVEDAVDSDKDPEKEHEIYQRILDILAQTKQNDEMEAKL